jgi:hypothetical protein
MRDEVNHYASQRVTVFFAGYTPHFGEQALLFVFRVDLFCEVLPYAEGDAVDFVMGHTGLNGLAYTVTQELFPLFEVAQYGHRDPSSEVLAGMVLHEI